MLGTSLGLEPKGHDAKELADMLGVTDGAVGMWSEAREPDRTSSQLARISGVSVDYLLGHSDSPEADRGLPCQTA